MQSFTTPPQGMHPQEVDPPQSAPLQTSPASGIPEHTSVRSPRKGLFIILILVVLGLFGAAGVWAYTYVYSVPDDLFEQIVLSEEEVQSFVVDGGLHITEVTPPTYPDDMEAYYKNSQFGDINEATVGFRVAYEAKQEDVSSKNSFEMVVNSGEEIEDLTVETRGVDNVLYLRARNIPTFGFIDVSQFLKDWIKIDFADLGLEDFGVDNPLELLSPSLANIGKEGAEEKVEEIKAIIAEHKPIVITKVHGPRGIADLSMRHVSFALDKGALAKVIRALDDSAGADRIVDDLVFLESLTGDAWVGRSNNLVYQLNIEIVSTDEFDGRYRATIAVKVSGYNQSVQIVAPEESKTIEEVMKEALGGFGFGVSETSPLDGYYCDADYSETYEQDCFVRKKDYLRALSDEELGVVCEVPDGEGYAGVCLQQREDRIDQILVEFETEESAQTFDAPVSYSLQDTYEDEHELVDKDTDGDGLSDYLELYAFKTDVNNPDTDGDGFSDGDEVDNGYDPLAKPE